MTEKERFIQEGRFPKSFFEEEVRNGFYVDSFRKRMWAVLLDMALELDRVCRKYNLTYYLSDGTLLGAVRHQGFIPWDDDFDVHMPRKDYEKFITLGHEFHNPIFLQTPNTDPNFFYAPARLRNSNTSGIIPMFKYQNFNQGIWLTIFPLDNMEPVKGEEIYKKINALNIENSTYMRLTNPELDETNRKRVENYSGRNPLDTYKEIHQLARTYENVETGYKVVMVHTMDNYKKKVFKAEDYCSCIPCKVEGYDFPIPCGYDNLLKQYYGDYMKLPPVEERGKKHSSVIWNPDVPYKKIIDELW